MLSQIDGPVVERYTFGAEEGLLERLGRPVSAARADAPLRVHDAVPRHVAFSVERRQRVPHLSGVPREPRGRRDVTVGRDAADRDASDGVIDARAAGHVRKSVG